MAGIAALKMPAIHSRWASRDKYLPTSLAAEFLGTALFQLLAGSVADDPLQSAFAFTALLYATKFVSGGHLNPAVSLAALMSGHIDWLRGVTYIVAQLLGGIAGAVAQAWISPDSSFGKTGPGCYAPIKDVSNWGVWGWESVLTFTLILVFYASVLIRPGHGDSSPLAVGLALFAGLATGGTFTGGSPLNPARVLAGTLVFNCFWKYAFVYISGHLTAAVLASAWAIWAYGRGDFFKYDSATGSLRESLLGSAGAAEPAGALAPQFNPASGGYAGAGPREGGENIDA
uniref:Aquaporin n=1 Tax=Chlamydomonas leiostraca TaxID=1034604 RepID=A0A7S0RNQ7_9CHLO|mmetsp:Transcript_27644/g.70418  ORF Transcript_27644/g.70418 Transcript_27644/m.70418 type:complete len:287 (+) Transcript_27644:265-1125(+)